MTGRRRATGKVIGSIATATRRREHFEQLAADAPTADARIRVQGEHLAAIARSAPAVAVRIGEALGRLIEETATEGAAR